MSTGIQWTQETWNPITGCSKVSQGCKNCYAERIWKKVYGSRPFTDVRFHSDRLMKPLSWRTPKMVFVNSMSDLFHERVDRQVIAQVFAVMGWAWWHTFQVLTKRSERMCELLNDQEFWRFVAGHMEEMRGGALANQPTELFAYRASSHGLPEDILAGKVKALQNIWLCVSVENDENAQKRIPDLLNTPAAIRGVSAEPLIGPLHFQQEDCEVSFSWLEGFPYSDKPIPKLDWVIVGGESGTKAESRPFDLRWAYDIIRECKAAHVPVFIKQLGRNPVFSGGDGRAAGFNLKHIHDSHGGNMNEWPEDLRIREFPA